MHLSSLLDCDVVAVENDDQLTLLVELTAPAAPITTRAPATLQVVLDRSGSMSGDRLESAKTALMSLVDKLDPTDNFGLVAFDDQVHVVVPSGPIIDKAALKQRIAAVHSGGQTDLSAGYLRGLQEVRRVATDAGATLLLISDGHANAGITDPTRLGQVAAEASSTRVTTSTLGVGLGYDETLLAAVARGGRGNELFAEEADTAAALIAGEVDGLLTQVAQAASLRIRATDVVPAITLLNDLPVVGLDDGIMVELGAFYGGESRRLVLRLDIPGIAALGLKQVATLELTHVELPGLVQHTTTVPVMVNVVPGDEAAGRIPNAVVVSEALFQETQRSKKEASWRLSQGDLAGATSLFSAAEDSLRAFSLSAPSGLAGELISEADELRAMAEEAAFDMQRTAKSSSYSQARKSRQRGRATSGGSFDLTSLGGVALPVQLEEWELVRLERLATSARAIRAMVGGFLDSGTCKDIASQLGTEHELEAFFVDAGEYGGARVDRR